MMDGLGGEHQVIEPSDSALYFIQRDIIIPTVNLFSLKKEDEDRTGEDSVGGTQRFVLYGVEIELLYFWKAFFYKMMNFGLEGYARGAFIVVKIEHGCRKGL